MWFRRVAGESPELQRGWEPASMEKRTAVYPGSFDPVTAGHLEAMLED